MKSNELMAKIRNKRIKLILGVCLILITLSSISIRINNDFWFLLKSGKYVIENGIPYTEPFTMHKEFDFVMQQWLSATIFYQIYNKLGIYGMMLLVSLIAAASTTVFYKICLYVSEGNTFISFLVGILYSFTNILSFVTRPQIFTILLLVLEIYFLERFTKEQNSKYLFPLPIISILQINLHASMWWMLIVFMLPYLMDSFTIKKLKIYGENKKKIQLCVAGIAVFLAGFINPYGIDAITYLFKSYGIDEINNVVYEMHSVSINEITGKYLFIILLIIIFVYIFYRKGAYKIRYIFLTLGTTYLMLSSYRSIFLFAIGSIFPMAYYLKDALKDKQPDNVENNGKTKNLLVGLSIVMMIVVVAKFVGYDKSVSEPEAKGAYEYLLKNYKADEVVPFSLYDDGGYAEYLGFMPYIDPRAEVFVKKNNGKADVMKEYVDLMLGNVYYKDVFNKYKFTHLIICNKGILNTYVSKDADYKKIYSDDNRVVFEYIGKKIN